MLLQKDNMGQIYSQESQDASVKHDSEIAEKTNPMYQNKENGHNTKILITHEGKKTLHLELLKANMHNKEIDDKKLQINNFVTGHVVGTQSDNLMQLQFENDMLRKTVEKYRTLYNDLSKKVFILQGETIDSDVKITSL